MMLHKAFDIYFIRGRVRKNIYSMIFIYFFCIGQELYACTRGIGQYGEIKIKENLCIILKGVTNCKVGKVLILKAHTHTHTQAHTHTSSNSSSSSSNNSSSSSSNNSSSSNSK